MTFPLAARAFLTVVAMLAAAVSGAVALLLPAGLGQTVLTHVCSTAAGIGLAIALVRGVDRRPVAALGLGRPPWRACLIALAVVSACTAAGTALAASLGLTTTTAPAPQVSVSILLTMLTQSFLLQAIPEEVLFRGYLVQTALGRLRPWGVTALSVLVFALPHLLSSSGADTLTERMLFLLLPLGFALLATAFRLRTGSVWPAVAVHGGFHVSWFVAGLFVAQCPETYAAYLAVIGGVLVLAGLAAASFAVRSTPSHTPQPALLPA